MLINYLYSNIRYDRLDVVFSYNSAELHIFGKENISRNTLACDFSQRKIQKEGLSLDKKH